MPSPIGGSAPPNCPANVGSGNKSNWMTKLFLVIWSVVSKIISYLPGSVKVTDACSRIRSWLGRPVTASKKQEEDKTEKRPVSTLLPPEDQGGAQAPAVPPIPTSVRYDGALGCWVGSHQPEEGTAPFEGEANPDRSPCEPDETPGEGSSWASCPIEEALDIDSEDDF